MKLVCIVVCYVFLLPLRFVYVLVRVPVGQVSRRSRGCTIGYAVVLYFCAKIDEPRHVSQFWYVSHATEFLHEKCYLSCVALHMCVYICHKVSPSSLVPGTVIFGLCRIDGCMNEIQCSMTMICNMCTECHAFVYRLQPAYKLDTNFALLSEARRLSGMWVKFDMFFMQQNYYMISHVLLCICVCIYVAWFRLRR